MKLEKTNAQLVQIYSILKNMDRLEANARFHYARKRNMDKLFPFWKKNHVLLMAEPSENRGKYEEERTPIIEQFADKGEDGKPIVEEGRYKISKDNEPLLQIEIDKLLEKYPDVKVAMDKAEKEHDEWAAEETVFEFYTVKLENVPDLPGFIFDTIEPIMIDPNNL